MQGVWIQPRDMDALVIDGGHNAGLGADQFDLAVGQHAGRDRHLIEPDRGIRVLSERGFQFGLVPGGSGGIHCSVGRRGDQRIIKTIARMVVDEKSIDRLARLGIQGKNGFKGVGALIDYIGDIDQILCFFIQFFPEAQLNQLVMRIGHDIRIREKVSFCEFRGLGDLIEWNQIRGGQFLGGFYRWRQRWGGRQG